MIGYRRLSIGVIASALLVPVASAQSFEEPSTRPERTDYRETSRYADVVAFLDDVVARSPRLHQSHFGYTHEGRALPLVIVGPDKPLSLEEIRDSDHLRVFVQANIHAGEVCGKEALQMLLRDLAAGRFAHWSDNLILLLAPIYNADGNERISLTHRPGQHGPLGGMGQRPNAQDLDLNRDHMKVESSEARGLIGLFNAADPHIIVDLHTTNGSVHGYHLTYSPPLHPNTSPGIDRLLRQDWLPTLTERIRKADGWEFYYYGNLSGRGEARGWYTFDHRPRFNNNYAGLRNRFGILSEAYSYATFEERVLASRRFVEEICEYAHQHAAEIRAITEAADQESVIGRELAVTATHRRSEQPVTILLGGATAEVNPYSGARMRRRTDEHRPETMHEYGAFTATATEKVPAAYLVPSSLRSVIEKLTVHGIAFRELDSAWRGSVEMFRIESSTEAEREFQGHRERAVTGAWLASDVESELPDMLLVPMNQPLARLAFMLLEPRSDDGLVNWNFLDRAMRDATTVPILRTHDASVLSSGQGN